MRLAAAFLIVASVSVGIVFMANQEPASGQGALPPYPTPYDYWSFETEFDTNDELDPSHHQSVLRIPTNMKLFVQQTTPGRILVRPAEPLSNIGGTIQKEQDGEWAFDLTVTTTLRNFSGVKMTFTGHISADFTTMSGRYALGTNGVFPGGNPIAFDVKMKASATATAAANATPTQPAPPQSPTPTRMPSATSTPTETPAPTASPGPYGNGDVNKDGAIDSVDAALVLQHTAGLFDLGARVHNADVNQDGEITSVDSLLILQYSGGYIHSLPVAPPH